jgi:hypothetical protein
MTTNKCIPSTERRATRWARKHHIEEMQAC